MNEKLIYTVNGVNYLLFEVKVNSEVAENLLNVVTRYKGILQSYDKNTGFWETKHHLKFLIPEENVMNFSNYKSSL
jgi:hypothetical protein